MIIATHDGSFHADETTACAILTFLHENSTIIRSRDEIELEKADIVIDVSNKNDSKHFDHHSKDFTLCRDNGVKYATAGLMWKKFGKDYLKKVASTTSLKFTPSAKIIDMAFERIDREIMIPIDLNDNGQLTSYVHDLASPKTEGENEVLNRLSDFQSSTPDIPYLVAMMNLPSQIGQDQDKAFLQTVKILKTLLLSAAINAICTESGIAKVLDIYTGGQILIMHEKYPWTQAVLNYPDVFKDCLIAVYPDRNNRWRVQSLPLSKAQRFTNRLPAPATWRGLNDKELDAATGLCNMTFIHKSGFTGGAMTYEDNLELAKLWLEKGLEEKNQK